MRREGKREKTLNYPIIDYPLVVCVSVCFLSVKYHPFVENDVGVHDDVARIARWIWSFPVKQPDVCYTIDSAAYVYLIRYINNPRIDFLAVAPAVASVEPRAVFIRFDAFRHAIGATERIRRIGERAHVRVSIIDGETM